MLNFSVLMLRPEGLNYLDVEKPRIIAFCGKGGVGKSTCAATTAFHFANKGLRTLLISSDPTPSISDMLESDVRGQVKQVAELSKLYAVELDYELIVEKWKEKFGVEVYEVISSFLPIDKDIIGYVAGAPGIDEEFALSYLLELYESGKYDVIVWDTAPAGGTLSLLKLQDKFYTHLGEAARLYARIRRAVEILTTGKGKRDPLAIISQWENLAQRVLNMLRDEKTSVIVVTIAEALGVRQSERLIKELEQFGMRVSKVLVNYVMSEDTCNCSFHQERMAMQKHYIEMLKTLCGEKIGIAILPQLAREVRGLEAISKVEKLLF